MSCNDFREQNIEKNGGVSDESKEKFYTYEEALDIAGTGRYSYGLLCACGMTIMAMGLDVFGLSITLATSSCDLNLSLQQKGILASMPFAGVLVMAYVWGYLSDTKGRKTVLMWTMPISFIFGVASSFAPNFLFIAVCKFLGAGFSSAANSTSYMLIGESCPHRVRDKFILIMAAMLMSTEMFSFVWAYFVLPLEFSYYIPLMDITFRPWRLLNLLMALPLGLSSLFIMFYEESPKFLANSGHTEKALITLKIIYDTNKKNSSIEFPVTRLVPTEQDTTKVKPFLKSLVDQTAPLFKPPYLWNTLKLYYLYILVISTNNTFVMWFPVLVNKIFLESPNAAASGNLCSTFNVTEQEDFLPDHLDICDDTLSDATIWGGFFTSTYSVLIMLLAVPFSSRKRWILFVCYTMTAVGTLGVNLTNDPIATVVFYSFILSTGLGIGSISSYFVDLYPTSHRGMVACLGLMVGRASTGLGTNLLGAVVADYCIATFYAWTAYVLSGVVVTMLLPPDKKSEKCEYKSDGS